MSVFLLMLISQKPVSNILLFPIWKRSRLCCRSETFGSLWSCTIVFNSLWPDFCGLIIFVVWLFLWPDYSCGLIIFVAWLFFVTWIILWPGYFWGRIFVAWSFLLPDYFCGLIFWWPDFFVAWLFWLFFLRSWIFSTANHSFFSAGHLAVSFKSVLGF